MYSWRLFHEAHKINKAFMCQVTKSKEINSAIYPWIDLFVLVFFHCYFKTKGKEKKIEILKIKMMLFLLGFDPRALYGRKANDRYNHLTAKDSLES